MNETEVALSGPLRFRECSRFPPECQVFVRNRRMHRGDRRGEASR